MYVIHGLDTPFVSGLNAWIVVLVVEHEKYLAALDLTSDVVTIPTWLASSGHSTRTQNKVK